VFSIDIEIKHLKFKAGQDWEYIVSVVENYDWAITDMEDTWLDDGDKIETDMTIIVMDANSTFNDTGRGHSLDDVWGVFEWSENPILEDWFGGLKEGKYEVELYWASYDEDGDYEDHEDYEGDYLYFNRAIKKVTGKPKWQSNLKQSLGF